MKKDGTIDTCNSSDEPKEIILTQSQKDTYYMIPFT